MRKRRALIIGLAAMISAACQAQEWPQDIKVGGLFNVWQTQMLDNSLRSGTYVPYYSGAGRSEAKENGTNVRRTEIEVYGKATDKAEFKLILDPSISAGPGTTKPSILVDLFMDYSFTDRLKLTVGQFRPLQTFEATVLSTKDLLFNERAMMTRQFGDKRDRGLVFAYEFADPKTFGAKLSVGVFNGTGELNDGKANDANAGKDYVARLEMNVGKEHKFGVYTLQGSANATDKGGSDAVVQFTPPAGWPTKDVIYANKDKTTNYGAYYSYRENGFIFDAEVMTGLLGRRGATLGVTSPGRDYLDQKFLGYYVNGGYTFGPHTLVARYDVMNYNYGNNYYPGATPLFTDPTFKETTLGYTYAFNVEKIRAANIKVNYIHRSNNILKNVAGQTGLQGGDTLMIGFQIAF